MPLIQTKTLRLLHRYMGLFFAPAILFFALTGALQTFSFHETTRGSAYVPPRWMVYLGQLHKKQNLSVRPPKPGDPGMNLHALPAPIADVGITPASLALKWFVFLMSLGLAATDLLGILMALRYGGPRGMVWLMLALGTVFPLAVIVMMRH